MAFKPKQKQTFIKVPRTFFATEEQQLAISTATQGYNLAIHAGSGTSKTTICEMISESLQVPSLYISFNKDIAEEAKQKFPSWVECKTIHSLAYQAIVKGTAFAKKGKIVGYWDSREIMEIIFPLLKDMEEEEQWNFVFTCVELLKGFCQSMNTHIMEYVVENLTKEKEGELSDYVYACDLVFNNLSDQFSRYKISHDVYLKLWQLSSPDLSKYKVIYLDEFQDTNPVCLDIFLEQDGKCQLIAVGDEAQSIYGWRGAINAFDFLPKPITISGIQGEYEEYNGNYNNKWKHLTLSESFRFTQEIADQANIILSALKLPLRLIGRGTKTETEISSKAIIVRNNATLVGKLLEAADYNEKVKVYADLSELWGQMYTAAAMYFSQNKETTDYGLYPNAYIKSFGTWKKLYESNTVEIRKIVNLLKKMNSVSWMGKTGIHAGIQKAKSAVWNEGDGDPDFILVTGHKSKGLEWDEIELTDDFLPYFPEDSEYEEVMERFKQEQGLQLIYVAITRARVRIIRSENFENFLYTLQD